jgi:ApbE superfamily uncharacterized protein (UPF0280 family)
MVLRVVFALIHVLELLSNSKINFYQHFFVTMIAIKPKGLFSHSFSIKESNCKILTDKPDLVHIAKEMIKYHRTQLEDYIKLNPSFQSSLKPIQVINPPEVVTWMAEAAQLANVGFMAAVAGVLADLAVEEMMENGAHVAIVENGGEVALDSNRSIDIALQAGEIPLSKRIGFRVTDFPLGVATSSGKFSHALSFGESDAVTVFAKDAGLADAVATAAGNIVKGYDIENAIQRGVNLALDVPGVYSTIIIFEEKIGFGGDLPKLIEIEPN